MHTKKRIAFIIHSLSSGGAERVVSNISNELIDSYHIIIITFVSGNPFYQLDDRIKVIYCFEAIEPSKTLWQALNMNLGLYKKISTILQNQQIDLAIGFMTNANIIATMAAKANKIPVIISERIDPSASEISFIWNKFRRWIYPKANFLVVQTEGIKKYFVPWISDTRIKILPNPLSPNIVDERDIDLPRENIVLNVGRLSDQKGQDVLINAFINLNPTNWKLVIVGEGKNRTHYEHLINSNDMSDKILLVGRKKNVVQYYKKSKIFAFTSRYEGFPNALIEAMYLGLPCISTDCPSGPSEMIIHGENGYLIKINDQKELEEKLLVLMQNDVLRTNFAKKAHKVAERFKPEYVTIKWRNIIESCLK